MQPTTIARYIPKPALLFLLVTRRSSSFSPVPPVVRLPQHHNYHHKSIILNKQQQSLLHNVQKKHCYNNNTYFNHNYNCIKLRHTLRSTNNNPTDTTISSTTTTTSMTFTTELSFTTDPKLQLSSLSSSANNEKQNNHITDIIFIGRKSSLTNIYQDSESFVNDDNTSPFQQNGKMFLSSMIDKLTSDVGKDSSSITSLVPIDNFNLQNNKTKNGEAKLISCTIISLPDKVSRNNHYMSLHKITDILSKVCPKYGNVKVYVMSDNPSKDAGPIAISIARCFPTYSSKTTKTTTSSDNKKSLFIDTCFLNNKCQSQQESQEFHPKILQSAQSASYAIRLACNLTDMPSNELTTNSYSNECHSIATSLGDCVTIEEIVGDKLADLNYGGIYNVGKGADQDCCPPRLIVMTYTPKDYKGDDSNDHDVESIALCGKGVIYDTGGLSLKTKAGMPGMKYDMGGSAGLLGGFVAAVQLEVPQKITLILAIVENAIGPQALRNDDIITMHSGKTVEINNTDAEGRLILADCVSHASKQGNGRTKNNIIIDMATLTGAQGIATGKKHAAILCNTLSIEHRIYNAGLRSGDLTYPVLYAPELLTSEFYSPVADMKNSVKDRSNAQTSCAGHFIESHLCEEYDGDWVHIDMAGPAKCNDRGTGFGVGLVLGLLNAPGFD